MFLYKSRIINVFENAKLLIWADKNILRLKTKMAKSKRKKAAKRKMSAMIPNISL